MSVLSYLQQLFLGGAPVSQTDISMDPTLGPPPNIDPRKNPWPLQPVSPAYIPYAGMAISNWRGASHDLREVARVEDVEPFVRQAFARKMALAVGQGFSIAGPNRYQNQWVERRLREIEEHSEQSITQLVESLIGSLVRYNNAFLVKVNAEGYGSGRTYNGRKPIAGLFCLPPEEMQSFQNPLTGEVLEWKQYRYSNSMSRYFRPDQVLHLTIGRRAGDRWGVPDLMPVMSDIRALRHMEEMVQMYIHRYVYPLLFWQVGNDKYPARALESPDPATGARTEIELAVARLRQLPNEGAIVGTHRDKIAAVALGDAKVNPEQLLGYFKSRVLSGLGVSAVDMGEGDCYTDDHEVMTRIGWKRHTQVEDNEDILVWDPATRTTRWEVPQYKYSATYSGKMVEIPRMGLRVTTEHRIVVDDGEGKSRIIPAWSLLQMPKTSSVSFMHGGAMQPRSDKNLDRFIASMTVKGSVVDAEAWGFILACFIVAGVMTDDEGHVMFVSSEAEVSASISGALREMVRRYSGLGFALHGTDVVVHGDTFWRYIRILGASKTEIIATAAQNETLRESIHRNLLHNFGGGTGRLLTSNELIAEGLQVWSAVSGAALRRVKDGRALMDLRRFSTAVRVSDIEETQAPGQHIFCYAVSTGCFVVRTPLGVVLAQGNTATRSTSDNMSKNLVNSVRIIQKTVAEGMDRVLVDLVQESRSPNQAADPNYQPRLSFPEIDTEMKIRMESHAADLYTKGVLTNGEARGRLGLKPLRGAEEVDSVETLFSAIVGRLKNEASGGVPSEDPETLQADMMRAWFAVHRSGKSDEVLAARRRARVQARALGGLLDSLYFGGVSGISRVRAWRMYDRAITRVVFGG